MQQASQMFRQRVGKIRTGLLQLLITFFTRIVERWFEIEQKERISLSGTLVSDSRAREK